MRCLQAFEAAARLSNFTAAASELHTSQSSISRHIADLEKIVGGELFLREKQRVRLSDKGEHLYRSVTHGLNGIRSGLQVVSDWAAPSQVTIACTHAVSHLLLMPNFEALKAAMGEMSQVRIMTYEYEILETVMDPQADIVFEYGQGAVATVDRVKVLSEAVCPLAAPDFFEQWRDVLTGPLQAWEKLPLLTMATPNRGWATWQDWFKHQGLKDFAGDFIEFENYVYLLEAAAAGRGLALGARGLVESYLLAGRLMPLRNRYVEFDRALYAALTERGRNNRSARHCLAELERIMQSSA